MGSLRAERIYGFPPGAREGDGREINERVEELADEKGASMAQIALAWLAEPYEPVPVSGHE